MTIFEATLVLISDNNVNNTVLKHLQVTPEFLPMWLTLHRELSIRHVRSKTIWSRVNGSLKKNHLQCISLFGEKANQL